MPPIRRKAPKKDDAPPTQPPPKTPATPQGVQVTTAADVLCLALAGLATKATELLQLVIEDHDES